MGPEGLVLLFFYFFFVHVWSCILFLHLCFLSPLQEEEGETDVDDESEDRSVSDLEFPASDDDRPGSYGSICAF